MPRLLVSPGHQQPCMEDKHIHVFHVILHQPPPWQFSQFSFNRILLTIYSRQLALHHKYRNHAAFGNRNWLDEDLIYITPECLRNDGKILPISTNMMWIGIPYSMVILILTTDSPWSILWTPIMKSPWRASKLGVFCDYIIGAKSILHVLLRKLL